MAAGRGGQLKWPATAQPVLSSSSVQMHPLGTRAEDRYGREFRYALADAVALVAGNALQAQAQVTQHQDMTPSAAAIDDTTLTMTPGAAAGAANLYADGFAVIDTTPGEGYSYPIQSHPAIGSATAFTVKLATGWSVQVALVAATSRISLYPNPYRNVIQCPVTTLTNIPVGVAAYPIAASEYGWIGSHGVFSTLVVGTPAVGNAVVAQASTAGAVAIASGTLPVVGFMMDTGQAGKLEGVFWTL